MATVKFYESSLSNETETLKVRTGSKIETIVRKFINERTEPEMVEVYFPDEDITKLIPLEKDSYDIITIANGVEVDLNYKVQKNDEVVVMVLQHDSGNNTSTGWGVAGIVIGIIGLVALAVATYGAAAGWSAIGMSLLLAGGATTLSIGVALMQYGFSPNTSNSNVKNGSSDLGAEQEGLLSINGGNNEPIIGKNYPLVLGKHLINPYIVGSPYHETFNRCNNGNYKNSGSTRPLNSSRATKDYYIPYTEDTQVDLTNLKYDHHDDGQYYKALYCAGYGPLRLTDFKIGDIKLAYNRPFNSPGMQRIVDEIIELQKGGNINILNRPIIPGAMMAEKGWYKDTKGYSTLMSYAYPNEGEGYDKYIIVTPIVVNKNTGMVDKILTEEELNIEAAKIYATIKDDGSYVDDLGIMVTKVFFVKDYESETGYKNAEVATICKLEERANKLHELGDLYARRFIAGSIMHGLLTGTEEDYDAGDILRKWKNNDIQLEILQAGDYVVDGEKWSSIYPFSVKEDEVNAPILYAYDKDISKVGEVIYKGVSIPCGYRTNTVRFSKSCPQRLEVEIDMPSGLYATYTHSTDGGSSWPVYKQIPINIAVQWRYASSDEDSSNAESPEGWHDFDYELLNERNQNSNGDVEDTYVRKYPSTYTIDTRRLELESNKGLNPESSFNPKNNAEWINKHGQVFELSNSLCPHSFEWQEVEINETELKALAAEGRIRYHVQTFNVCYKEREQIYEEIWHWWTVGLLGFPIRERRPTGRYIDVFPRGVHMPVYPNMWEIHYEGEDETYIDEEGIEHKIDATGNPMVCFNTYVIEKTDRWDDDFQEIEYVEMPACYDTSGNWVSYKIPLKLRVKKPTGKVVSNSYNKDTYNTKERRYVFVKEFSAEECQKLLDLDGKKSEYYDSVEVRVIRLSPCFINEVGTNDKYNSPMQYEDLVKWTYLRTWSFDKEAYTNAVEQAIKKGIDPSTLDPAGYGERPIPKEDLNKFCYIALSLKQDVAETGGSSLDKLSCIATSLQPNYDMLKHMWTPCYDDKGNVEELKLFDNYEYYYTSFENNEKKQYIKLPITKTSEDLSERLLYEKLGFDNIEEGYRTNAKYQYEYGLTTEYNNLFFYKKSGNDYYDKIRSVFFENKLESITNACHPGNKPVYNITVPKLFLTQPVMNEFNSQNSASAAIYAFIGGHLKGDAKTFDPIELNAFSEMYEFCNDVTDGSLETYKSPNIKYSEDLAKIWEEALIYINPDLVRHNEILRNAPVNAVWRGCYDYVINDIMRLAGINEFFKQQFIKYLEDKNSFAAADGKLHIQYNCNGVIGSQIKLETLLYNILVTGRCSIRRGENNKYEPLIGRGGRYPVTVINQRNCLAMSNSRNFEDTVSGFNVTYIDENDNYEQNNIYVMDDGESEKHPTKKIQPFKLDYVTNPMQMRSLARFNLANLLYQKEVYSRTVGILGYSIALGDVVLIQDDTLLVGTDRGGRIKEIFTDDATNTIVGFTTDEPFDYRGELDEEGLCKFGCTVVQPGKFGDSRTVTIRCAKPNEDKCFGKATNIYEQVQVYYEYINGEYVIANPQPQNQEDIDAKSYYINVKTYHMQEGITNLFLFEHPIFLSSELSEDSEIDGLFYTYRPQEGNLVAYGNVGSITTKAIVSIIKPKEKGTFDLTLVPYNEDLYQYGEKYPFFKSNMTSPYRDESDFRFLDHPTTSDRSEERADTQNMIAATISDGKPSAPFINYLMFNRDGIELKCTPTGSSLKDSVHLYHWKITKGDGSEITLVTSASETTYLFDRNVEGYPEKSELQNWKFQVATENINGTFSDYSDKAYGGFITPDYTWLPSEPVIENPVAEKDGFTVKWTYEPNLGSSRFIVSVYDGDELLFTSPETSLTYYEYKFNRDVDRYPEKSDFPNTRNLNNYRVEVTHFNEAYSKTSEGCRKGTKGINVNNYGTWYLGEFTISNVSKDVIDRTVILRFAAPTTPNITYYGDTKYKVSIKRVGIDYGKSASYDKDKVYYSYIDGNYIIADPQPKDLDEVLAGTYYTIEEYPEFSVDTDWYKPDLYTSPFPVEGDSRENAYKVADSEGGYEVCGDRYSQTLPLIGQGSGKIVNTIYEYNVTAFNESGAEVTITSPFAVTALCTSITDIVKSQADYKTLYVEKLSAIVANIGLVNQGGFGSFSSWENYWALSDLTAEDSGVEGGIKRGAFRVGDKNEFITVIPPHSHIGEEGTEGYIENKGDNYKIVIKAGNITLSTDGTQFDAGTYIYDEVEKTKRMKLTSEGIIIQEEVEPDVWEQKAQITVSTGGNLTITNAGADDPSLPVNGTGVASDTIIYHFEKSLKDTNQGNAGLLEFENITFEKSSVIKNQEYSIDGIVYRKATPGDMCFFNNSDTIMVGNKLVNLKYDSVRSDIDDWNELLGTDKFKWGNK